MIGASRVRPIHTSHYRIDSRGDSQGRRVCDAVCLGSSMASSMPLVDFPMNSRRNRDKCDPCVVMEHECSSLVSKVGATAHWHCENQLSADPPLSQPDHDDGAHYHRFSLR